MQNNWLEESDERLKKLEMLGNRLSEAIAKVPESSQPSETDDLPRVDDETVKERIEATIQSMIRGMPVIDIIASLQTAYGISKRQAHRYIADARLELQNVSYRKPIPMLGLLLHRSEYLYHQACLKGDLEAARKILKMGMTFYAQLRK